MLPESLIYKIKTIFLEMLLYGFLTFYSQGVAILAQVVMYAILLSYGVRILEEENRIQSKKLIDKSKKEEMGELLLVIAHQLKTP
jgi:hypothetical protein